MNIFAKAILATAVIAAVTPAYAQRTIQPKLPEIVANGGKPGGTKITQHCAGATFCNVLISKCAEEGGHWSESQHDGQGRPTKGACVY